MTRRQTPAPAPETELGRLVAAVASATTQLRSIRDDLDPTQLGRLTAAVESAAAQLQTIREVLDDIYCELQWVVRNPERFRGSEQSPVATIPVDARSDSIETPVRAEAEPMPAAPASPAETSPPVPPPSPVAAERPAVEARQPGRGKKKRRPLFERIFARPHLTALARIIGGNELPLPEVQQQIGQLGIAYGPAEIAEAEEILICDRNKQPPTIRLTEEARKLAAYLVPADQGSASVSRPGE